HLNRKERAADWSNDGVNRVPRRVDPRDFVGEKFQDVENAGDCDDDRIAQDLERLILQRERDPVKMDGETGCENGQVKIDPGEGGKPERDAEEIEFGHPELWRLLVQSQGGDVDLMCIPQSVARRGQSYPRSTG